MNPDVPLPTAQQLKEFCGSHRIVKLAVYGSALREDFGPESDIDLLVKFDPDADVPLFDRVRAQDEIAPLFGGRRIDLVTADSLVRYIRDRVLAEAELLYPRQVPARQPPLALDDDTPLRLMRDRARKAMARSEGRTRDDLDDDRTLNDLVCYAVQRVGLFAGRVSEACRKELPGIDFDGLADLSRRLIEEYDAIDLDRLWAAATETCPTVVTQLDAFLPPEDQRPGAYRGEPLDW